MKYDKMVCSVVVTQQTLILPSLVRIQADQPKKEMDKKEDMDTILQALKAENERSKKTSEEYIRNQLIMKWILKFVNLFGDYFVFFYIMWSAITAILMFYSPWLALISLTFSQLNNINKLILLLMYHIKQRKR